MRQWAESSQSKNHEDRVVGKGYTSMTHCTNLFPMPQALKIGQSSRQTQHGIWTMSRVKRGCSGSTKKGARKTMRAQSPQWGVWIQRQSLVRCRGARLCNSMDAILPVQNQDFTWFGEKFVKILGTVAQTESCINRQRVGICGKSCED